MASTPSASRATSSFRVQVLGPFALQRDGVPVDVGKWQPRVATLFKLLATAPGYRRSRDEITDLLWPDSTPEAGAGNVRMVIYRLRQALGGDPSPVVLEHGWVALNPAYTWELDLERFERLARELGTDTAALEEAAGLYRGEPLVENRYEDWAAPIREAVQRKWKDVCMHLARLHRTRGSQEEAAVWLERLLEGDPLYEQALQELLSILADLGRRTEALRRYRQFEQILSEEMDVPPEPETLDLVARLEGYLRQAAAPVPEEQQREILPVIPRYPLISMGPFVGRRGEMAEVLAAMPPSGTGAPHLILLAAEAGNGKTRMLAEIAWRAREAGTLTLAGGCYEQESRLPYGPIHDALTDYVRTEPEPVLRAQLEGVLPELAQVVPQTRARLGNLEDAHPGDTGDLRLALFAAVGQTLERISQDRPLVLLLDDLHWADDATLQLLHFLLRQPALDRMLIVGAYRPEEASEDGSLLQLVAELQQQARGEARRARLIPLTPLSEEELAAVLEGRKGARCSRSLVRDLHGQSGGNPFFAVQMLRLLDQEKQLEQREDGWRLTAHAAFELPVEVRETVARRLRRLEPDEQEVLSLGAVLGREFSFPALEAMWDGGECALFAALEAARISYVLGETEGGYVFRHPLLREVVYDRIPPQRRIRLHRRAGAALELLYGEGRNRHAAELAWHGLRGENREQALFYSLLAGEQAAALYAYGEAEQHYRAALELAAEPADYPDAGRLQLHAQVLEKLGGLLKTVGRYPESIELLDRAVDRYAAVEDLEGQRRAVAQIGRVYLAMGALDEGVSRLEGALADLGGESPSKGLAAVYLSLAFLLFRHGRYLEQLEAGERAAALARSSGGDGLLPEAELVRAYALPFMGRSSDFGGAMENVVRLAEEAGDLPTLSRALCSLGPYTAEKGELDKAHGYLTRALELAERLGDRSRIAFVTSTCGMIAYWRGAWDEAQAFFERSLAIYQELDALPDALSCLFGLGAVAMARGDWDTGMRYLEEHIQNARSVGDYRWLHAVHLLMAERDLLEGRPERARDCIEGLRNVAEVSEVALRDVLPVLAQAHLEMGDLAGAELIVAGAVQQARADDAGMILAEALRVQGVVLAAQGRWEEAEQRFQEALDLSRSMSCPYAAARTLYDYGATLARQGRWEPARQRLAEALLIFEQLGARPYVERTEQALMAAQPR